MLFTFVLFLSPVEMVFYETCMKNYQVNVPIAAQTFMKQHEVCTKVAINVVQNMDTKPDVPKLGEITHSWQK